MNGRKITLAVIGSFLALIAVAFLIIGGAVLWLYGTQQDADGFFSSPTWAVESSGHAVTSTDITLVRPGPTSWWPESGVATVRIDADSAVRSVFVGIGPSSDVAAYLADVAHDEVIDLDSRPVDVEYRRYEGGEPSVPPGTETFWAASAEGSGAQTVTWEIEPGDWTIVLMNADGSAGVSAGMSAAVRIGVLAPVAVALLVLGTLILGAAVAVILAATTRPAEKSPPTAAPAETAVAAGPQSVPPAAVARYPLRLEASLDPDLSRGLWLVKWLLAIPHYVVLAFLWVAFGLLTVVAWFAILFTGRYPRGIFDFNVGVMRWSWRVAYYTYGGLGTDRYPPFSLGDEDYPATLTVEYPERLSRGLVFVKWLLAIPHFLIVGILTSAAVTAGSQAGNVDNPGFVVGGGLIGLLVLIAGFSLLFTGRYPRGIFDLVIGLNRWVARVGAYAALMRDEYPPFVLDTGGGEPGTGPPPPPDTPTPGAAPTSPELIGV